MIRTLHWPTVEKEIMQEQRICVHREVDGHLAFPRILDEIILLRISDSVCKGLTKLVTPDFQSPLKATKPYYLLL